MMKYLVPVAIAAAALGVSAPASATGKMTCDVPQKNWKSQAALTQTLTKQGWKITKAKVDGGCYEVYGTTPQGDKVEAYFDPATFEKLMVSRRGKIIYHKPGHKHGS